MARRDESATGQLMRIALGIDVALLFFAVLTLRGLRVFPELWLWVGAAGVLVLIVALYRLVPTPPAVWLGHIFHASALALFLVDTAIGLSTLVPIGFWLFAAIRGPQLDGLSARDSGQGS